MPRPNSNSADKAIGKRLKQLRQRSKVSQTVLGKHLGVSFQQVQKYESGTNRVSAASLAKLADFLDTPLKDLLGSPPAQTSGTKQKARRDIDKFARSREGRELIANLLEIESRTVRRLLIEMIKALGQRAE
jgi:transcriptional regulator with XRE-family HTH domain